MRTISAATFALAGGRPPRGASRSMPGSPDLAKRLRHKHTVFMPLPSSAAISLLSLLSAAASTILARKINRAGVLLPRAHFCSVFRSSSEILIALATRMIPSS